MGDGAAGTGALRVLQVVQKPQRRGAEVFANDLTAALCRQGHDARIVYLYPADGPDPWPSNGTSTVLGGNEAHVLERTVGFHPGLLRRLTRAVSAFGPDVVQANGARSLKYGALATRVGRHRRPFVYRNIGEPDVWVTNRRARAFYRSVVMPAVDGIVGVSDATLASVQRAYGTVAPTRRIPRGVDLERFVPARTRADVRAELSTPESATVLAFVGQLSPEKRVDRFVETVARARRERPEVIGWVVGSGPGEAALRAAVDAAGADGFRLLGQRSDLADLLSASDLLVLTSDTEGVPGVILEAGAVGVPSVATDVGGVGECVRTGETGVLVAADDADGLVAAVLALVDDPPARAAMGQAARALVEGEFALTTIVEQYVALYRELLAGRG